jgi:hypothetical protein
MTEDKWKSLVSGLIPAGRTVLVKAPCGWFKEPGCGLTTSVHAAQLFNARDDRLGDIPMSWEPHAGSSSVCYLADDVLCEPPAAGSLLALMAERIAEQAEAMTTLRAILADVPAPDDGE